MLCDAALGLGADMLDCLLRVFCRGDPLQLAQPGVGEVYVLPRPFVPGHLAGLAVPDPRAGCTDEESGQKGAGVGFPGIESEQIGVHRQGLSRADRATAQCTLRLTKAATRSPPAQNPNPP